MPIAYVFMDTFIKPGFITQTLCFKPSVQSQTPESFLITITNQECHEEAHLRYKAASIGTEKFMFPNNKAAGRTPLVYASSASSLSVFKSLSHLLIDLSTKALMLKVSAPFFMMTPCLKQKGYNHLELAYIVPLDPDMARAHASNCTGFNFNIKHKLNLDTQTCQYHKILFPLMGMDS